MDGLHREDSESNLTYTPFPDLDPCRHNHERHGPSCVSIPRLVVPEEILLIAWAVLLARYTQDERPVFRSNGDALQFEPDGRVLKRLACEVVGGDRFTGVYFDFAWGHNAQSGVLDFLYDPNARLGELKSSGLLPPNHLEQLVLQLRLAIVEVARDKNQPINHLIPVNPALSILNSNPRRARGPELLHRLVKWHQPTHNLAIDFLSRDGNHQSLTWDQLDNASSVLSREIYSQLSGRPRKDNRTSVVPILIPQSPEFYVAQLAILKAGCAFCPLDLDAPEERIRFILQDVSAVSIVTVGNFRDRLRGLTDINIIEAKLHCETPTAFQDVDIDPAGTAYIMYTSGSTGKPKGVVVSHNAAVQALLAHDHHIPPFSRFLQFASPTFDVSVFEIFFPWLRGSTLVSCDRRLMLDDLGSIVNSMDVDAAELTPTVAASLLQKRDNVPCLRVLLTIGEMLTKNVIEEFGQASGRQGMLFGMYGPTEAAIHCTLQPNFRTDHKVGIIGAPLDTVSAFILEPQSDDNRSHVEVLPVGQVGELAIGGYQLADGYLNRPEQTSAAFVDSDKYGRLYRTGDKARLLPDGSLECLGRMATGQVKLRGQRVELGEIEEAALRHPAVRAAVASTIHGIVVVFCLVDDNEVPTDSIQQLCRTWLPAFMLPGDIVTVRELPYLPSGKVDKKRLGEQYQARNSQELVKAVPKDKTETTILSIAQEILDQQIGVADALAHFGLDSLLAIRFASLLRRNGLFLPATEILKCRSIRELALRVSADESPHRRAKQHLKDQDLSSRLAKSALQNGGVAQRHSQLSKVLPCTPLQNAMLLETSRDQRAYWNWIEIELPSNPSEHEIRDVLQNLTAKNEILRSGFCGTDDHANPFALLAWQTMASSQVVVVDEFSRSHPNGIDSLLRALNVQVRFNHGPTRMLFQIHHALFDGWSMDLIVHDVSLLLSGKTAPSRPQYADVISHHLSNALSAENGSDLLYWQEKLSNVTPCTLPNLNGNHDGSVSLERLHRVSSVNFEALQSCAKKSYLNPQVYFQAAFALLLAAYARADNVMFGTVSSGRTLPVDGIEEIIGPCIATIPLRVDVGQSRSVLDLLRHIHRLNRELLEHCSLPLRDIKRCCDLQPGKPLFDTLLVWQESLVRPPNPELLRVVDSTDYLEFNLLLEIQPLDDSLQTRATFMESLIPRAHMQILLAQLDCLVSWMLKHEGEALDKTSQCFALDHLSIENETPSKVPFDGGVKALVKRQVSELPNTPALAFASRLQDSRISVETLTYAELNRKAEQLACYLASKGVKRDMLVAICMEKSVELYTCILATVYAGAGYLPLTPDTPRPRIKSILEAAEVALCLGKGPIVKDLGQLEECEIVNVDSLDAKAFESSKELQGISCEASDIAYAVFTSGSTGAPKGVLVTQQNLSSNIKDLINLYPLGTQPRLLQACSQAFDVSVFEIFFAWATGMCLCSTTKDSLFQDIEKVIRDFGITHLSLTPTVAALIKPENVPSVRFLVTSGEAVTEQVFQTWAEHGLWQGYGPSETTNICTVRPRVSRTDMINNIGKPFPNTSVFVLSQGTGFDLVPRGAVGELCFGGDQIFRGYLKMSELNSQKITEHPKFGRIYRSGDLGRLLVDGSILFEGRVDDQIKLRGQRIELGEINTTVLGMEDVRDCFSMVIQQSPQSVQQLITFWVPEGTAEIEFVVSQVQEETKTIIDAAYGLMQATLPAYMIPTNFIPISHLPMTSQGKIDKQRLIAAYKNLDMEVLNQFSPSSVSTQPDRDWTAEEKSLAAIVAEVLNVNSADISLHNSLFSLGLDSISAISIASRIRKKLNSHLDISTLLKSPTVSRLSKAIMDLSNARGSTTDATQKSEVRVFSTDIMETIKSTFKSKGKTVLKILPCTPLQEAMLSLGSDGLAYHNRTLLRIRGDIQMLKQSWQEMCQRHEILRTQFIPTNNSEYVYAQVVISEASLPWTELPAAAVDVEAFLRQGIRTSDEADHDFAKPYSLTHFKVEAKEYLMLQMHHTLYDALAIERLVYEIELHYSKHELPPAVSFEPFLGAMVSADRNSTDQFWAKHLKDFVPTGFPILSRQPPADGSAYSMESHFLNIELNELEQACKSISTTMLSIAQAAFVKILSSYLGRSDLCFGNVVSGRSLPIDDIERLVAPCFNTLPVRVDLSSASTNIELIKSLQQYNTDVIPFQLTSLRRIQAKAGHLGKRLFDTLFILQQPSRELDHDIWAIEGEHGEMDFPFVIELIPHVRKNGLQIFLHYQTHSIASKDISFIFEAFEDALRSCIKFSSADMSNFCSESDVQNAVNASNFIICSLNQATVPVFGIGELFLEGDRGNDDLTHASSIKKHGKNFSKTGKMVRRLPGKTYEEIKTGKDVDTAPSDGNMDATNDNRDVEWTEIELCMREIIADLTHSAQTQIGRHTTIYQLGLDSINAVQVAAKLREKGFRVSASDVMEYPSCSRLASFLRQKEQGPRSAPKFDLEGFNAKFKSAICTNCGLSGTEVTRIRPCTPLQSGLLAESIHSETPLYVNEIRLHLAKGTRIEQLKNAWRSTQQKYAMLRTGFATVDHGDIPMAMIEYTTSELPWKEFRHADKTEAIIEQQTAEILADLHRAPWRLLVFRSLHSDTLILLAHHALYDAQLLENILDDVAKAYSGLALSFALQPDAAIIEILEGCSDEAAESKVFWKDLGKQIAISRFPDLTPMVIDKGESYVETRTCLPPLADLEKSCGAIGTTLQAAAQAAWAQVLSSYVGEIGVTFGVVFSGRTTEITEQAAFPCIATVPVTCKVGGDAKQLLNHMLDFNARVRRHQFTPLSKIQRWTGHPEEPLFDTILTYQKRDVQVRDVTYPWDARDEKATVNYAVSIELEPFLHENSLVIRVAGNDSTLPKAQAKFMLEQIEDALTSLLSASSDNVYRETEFHERTLAITPAKERSLISKVRLLHEFVENTAHESPQKVALEFALSLDAAKFQQWDYRQIDQIGNRVAHLLQSYGAQVGGTVATCFDKCPEASFAFIGILKAGCAFVALDPTAPLARKSFIINDSQVSIVICTEKLAATLPHGNDVEVVTLDSYSLEKFPTTPVKLREKIQPDDVSYCLYTSGTTGTPKGCMITHENVVQAMLSFQRLFAGHWDQDSRWLQFASFHFDVSVLEQFWSWSVGICVVSAPRDLIFQDLAEAIRRLRITHIDLTPSLAKLLHPDDVPSLSRGVFITGGEQLKQEIIDVWGPGGVIYNGYGPTEATIGVTMFQRVPPEGKPSNIGKQFDNVGTYVLRPNSDMAVIRGGVGELCVSGKLVGKGYLNRPELTSERFPFLGKYGERIYRTGDLVRLLHDGTFIFLGRIDDQVKLRGQRLEVAEINNVIRQVLPDPGDVATLVLKHPKQQKDQLITFIMTGNSSAKQEAQSVAVVDDRQDYVQSAREACETKLPSYMIPSYFIPISAIPLTVNNKVDARSLQDIFSGLSLSNLQGLSQRRRDAASSSNPTEEKISTIFAGFLSIAVEEISPDTSIFELGLDSISAIRFTRVLRDAGFGNVTVSIVMKNSRIQSLAKALNVPSSSPEQASAITAAKQYIAACRHKHAATAAKALKVDQVDIESIAPCTALQEGIISRSLNVDNPVYFTTFLFEISNDIKFHKLRSAWTKVFEALQILRTRFVLTTDGYVQVALRRLRLPWTEQAFQKENEADTWLAASAAQWFEKNRDHFIEPFEIVLARCPKKSVMSLHIFHALYDGNSIQLLLDAVARSYANDEQLQFGPAFHEVLHHGPLCRVDGAQSFWTNLLSSARPSTLRPLIDQPAPSDCLVTVDVKCPERFDTVRQSLGVTEQAMFQACWSCVLLPHLGSDILFGHIVSGRSVELEDVDKVIGPLFNTIPFALRLRKDDTWKSVVKKCHDFNVSVLPYQQTPLRDILKWSKHGRDRPLFEVLFVFQKEVVASEASHNVFRRELKGQTDADYPLALDVERKSSGDFTFTLAAQSHFAEAGECLKILRGLEKTLHDLVATPTARIAALSNIHTKSDNGQETNEFQQSANAEVNGVTNFQWTSHALLLKSEIALMAGIAEDEVDEHCTILELGLDSIDAIKLSSSLKQHGIILSASSIMQSLTIPRMIRCALPESTNREIMRDGDLLADRQSKLIAYLTHEGKMSRAIDRVLPVTPLQEAMLSEMVNSDFGRYFNHDTFEVSNAISLPNLRLAWERTFATIPILQTCFIPVDDSEVDDTFAQVIHKHSVFPWSEITNDTPGDISELLEEITEDVRRTFTEQPPIRLMVFYCSETLYLTLSLPHAMYDGSSLQLLHETVHKFYLESERIEKLGYDGTHDENNPGDFEQTYDSALRLILNSLSEPSEAYWKHQLTGYTPSSLSYRYGAPKRIVDAVHREEIRSQITLDQLSLFCRRQGISLQAFGATCWSFVLAALYQELDVVFGLVVSGRDHPDTESVIFPTMNTVCVRSIIHGTRQNMLQYVQKTLTDIKPHQYFPLRKIQGSVQSHGRKLFDTLFLYQKRPSPSIHVEKPLYESIGGVSNVEYPICVEVEPVANNLVWRIACHDNIIDEAGTQIILRQLDTVAKDIINNPLTSAFDSDEKGISICALSPFQPKAIREISTNGPSPAPNAHDGLWSDMEDKVRRVLSAVSRIPEEEIAKDMSIFHLGLDSISAMKVSSSLRKHGIQLRASDILLASTISQIAAVAESHLSRESELMTNHNEIATALDLQNCRHLLDLVGIDASDVEVILPTTAGQDYMLSMWQNTEGTSFFPEFTWQAENCNDVQRFWKAWRQLVEQMPILRTYFIATDDRQQPFVQVVVRGGIHDPSIQALPDTTGSQTAFNVKQPMFHPSAQAANGKVVFKLRIHHALYDAFSLPALRKNLEIMLNGDKPNAGSTNALTKFLSSGVGQESRLKAKSFWTGYLADAPSPSLMQPSGSRSSRVELFKGAVVSAKPLMAIARKHGVSLHAVILAVWSRVYALSLRQAKNSSTVEDYDIVFGIYLANRAHSNDLRMTGFPTLNLVPLRVQSHSSDLVILARQIQDDLRKISTAENSAVRLCQIDEWTEGTVKPDCFVNFLSPPDEYSETEEGAHSNAQKVEVREVHDHALPDRKEIISPTTSEFMEPVELKKNPVKNSYLHSVDVEVAVRSGALDVGVFGPENMLGGLQGAERVLEGLTQSLLQLGSDPSSR
ncbi:MAG: NRPS [Bathelium mastoideum]|nr:MAG: NRPS [Bathelium mastoideum]